MARYVSNRDGGKTNEEGHYRFHVNGWSGNVLDDGLKVKQNSPLGMSVLIEPGDLKISYQNYGYTAWNDADEAVTISTADGSNPRIDRIVAYIDRVMSPSPSNSNNPGMLKFMTVAGTPAGSPVAASDVTVNSAVSNNPWCELAQVRVNAGVTTIDNSKITDKRTFATPKLASGSVTWDKLAGGSYSTSEVNTGAKWIDGKDIWKKTVNTGALPNTATKNIAHSISGYETFIGIQGFAYGSGANTLPLPYTDQSLTIAQVALYVAGDNIRILTGIDRTAYTSSYVTVFYTKT